MAAKSLTQEQCQYLHKAFPPPDCCICNGRADVNRVSGELDTLAMRLLLSESEGDRLAALLRQVLDTPSLAEQAEFKERLRAVLFKRGA